MWRGAAPYTCRMSVRVFDPLRLDLETFAQDGAVLDGLWPLRQLRRVAAAATIADAETGVADEVTWLARGERRKSRGSDGQVWLHLHVGTRLALECQRCLKPVLVPIEVDRSFLFVAGEEAAAQLDAESDDDVLALSRAYDLRELIEDELLLALPIVPRHEDCPEPLQLPPDDVIAEPEPSPFAALAALKRGGTLN